MEPVSGPNTTPLRIGCAAGFSGDRTDAAGPVVDALIAAGGPSFLIFECLAERTLALAQLARRVDPEHGYEPLLEELLRPVLGRCLAHGIRIVSNFGAANPRGAARRIARPRRRARPRAAADRGGRGRRPRLGRAASAAALGAGRRSRRRRRAVDDGLRQRLHRRRADCRRAARRGADRRHRSRRRPVAHGRPGARPSRLAARRLGPAGARHHGRATCSNAAPRSAAATTPTRATRTFPISPTSATRSPRSMPTATAPSPSRPAPAAGSTPTPSPSSCSTKCTIRRPISRPTWSPT